MSEYVVLPSEILAHSPSRDDGISINDEKAHRFWGCELIEEGGILLRLPQVVMVTGQTMLHRFYYRKSLRSFDAFRVAIGCLFLAAKIEESPRRIKDVLSVFYAIYRRRKWNKTSILQQLMSVESDSYYLWRDWLIMVERQLLIDLGFSLYSNMEHPHKYILYYVKVLDGTKPLAQKAWGYINDSLRIDVCVRYKAEVIACAAILISSRMLGIKLPSNPPWYTLFDVDQASLVEVSNQIMALYQQEKIVWLDPLTEVNPFAINDLPDADTVTVISKNVTETIVQDSIKSIAPADTEKESVHHQKSEETDTRSVQRCKRRDKHSPNRSQSHSRSRSRRRREYRSRRDNNARSRRRYRSSSHSRSRSHSSHRRSSSSRRSHRSRNHRSRSRSPHRH